MHGCRYTGLTGPHRHTWLTRTSEEWMREDTSQFLKWKSYQSTGARAVLAWFGARPVSGGPNQPVDAADVRRRAVLWGASK